MSFMCVICMDQLATTQQPSMDPTGNGKDIIATKCGHLYHRDCLDDWLTTQKSNGSCPTCKTRIPRRVFQRVSPYGDDNFPITTFSIEDTLQNQTWNGGQQVHQPRRPDSTSSTTSSIFSSSCDDSSSSTWNGNSNSHFGNSLSNNYNNSSGNSVGINSNGLHWNSPNTRGDRDDHRGSSNSSGSQGHSGSRIADQHGADGSVNQGVRETGIIEKLLHSYGFIQCCERQARLFFHFSQFEGTIEHLKLGDPVEFEMTYDRRTGKPIASYVTKIGPEVVLSEERVTGTVTTELHHESSGELQGRISYENRGECFFLPYCQEDIEGNVTLCTGDTVSFQIATNHRSGNLTARYVRLENPAQPVRYKGIVSSIKDSFGFIERADVAKEIFFHFSETRVHEGIVVGDNVEFNIQTRNGKEVASSITKLPYGTVVFEDIGTEILKGQMLKPIDKTQINPAAIGPTPRSETMQGRLRYRGPDRQELEVVYGEKDQKGCFTMRHGDWVEFQLAVDRRDKQQRATNITLLEESFVVSGERREEGVISAMKDGCGYISCAERDSKVFFRTTELLDYNRVPKIGDDVEFIIVPDPQSPVRQSAIRIKYLPPGTVQFEVPVSKDVAGVVIREPSTPWVSQEALAGILPSLANLGLPQTVTERLIQGLSSAEVIRQLNGAAAQEQQGEPGIISYQAHWQPETIIFHWKDCKDLRNIRTGTKVCFDIHQVRRNREIISANVRALEDLENCLPMNNMDKISQEIQHQQIDPMFSPPPNHPMQQRICQPPIQPPQPQQINFAPIMPTMPPLQSTPPMQNQIQNHNCPSIPTSPEPDNIPTGSSSCGSSSPIEEFQDQMSPTRSSPDMDRMANGSHSKYDRNRSGSESSANGSSGGRNPRFVMKGHIAALKDGFGFIETLAQDGEIFFHSSSLVGEFGALEVGQEVEYVISSKGGGSGKNAADMVKPVPNVSRRPEIFPNLLHGTVSRPLRGASSQSEYPGVIETADGHSFQFGITSMLNKKEIVQVGETVEFQVDAQNKAVNIRALRKKLRATVEAVKGPYGFLSYELEDGKKLFFHMSEVKDHTHLNPGDEVEFVVLQNPRNRKSSACSVVKLGESQRPERLLNRLSKLSVDESAPRLIVVRQPYGPDGSRGFNQPRIRRTPGILP